MFDNVLGGRTIGIFAADLNVNSYHIKVDGIIITTVSTDANGILQSSLTLPTGNHMIEIVTNSTQIDELYKTSTLAIFPNPTHSELNIVLPSSQSPFVTKIYDVNGKLVMKNSSQIKLNISSLSSGQYYIQVIQDDNYYSSKFIKQ